MSEISTLSRAKISDLAKLKQKKYRKQSARLILEGQRLMGQLAIYNIRPLELYVTDAGVLKDFGDTPAYQLQSRDLHKICDSEHPPSMAALYPAPLERRIDFNSALYLDSVSDPGNVGTIFRLAAAFGIGQILLSPGSCEVSSPKVVRASLGAVYHVPFSIMSHEELLALPRQRWYLDMEGETELFALPQSTESSIYVLGNEAHGVSDMLKQDPARGLRIEMSSKMESLNVAISAGILCHYLFCRSK